MVLRELGFGIVGAGAIARTHIAAIEGIKGARLIAIADPVLERAAEIGKEKGIAWHSDHRKMLEDRHVDIVCVCTPSGLRGQIAIDAAEAGKHVVAEKPLEVTLEKADAVIEACDRQRVKLAVIMQCRFLDDIEAMKRDVDEGRLGKLVLGDAYIKWHRSQEYYKSSTWRGTWAMDGGGVLMNQGIHYVDILQWVMGPVESVMAYACTRVRDIEVEDTLAACFKFANGAIGVIEGCTSAYRGLPARLEIRGDKGIIVNEAGLTKLREIEDDDRYVFDAIGTPGPASDPSVIAPLGHQRQLADMVQAVLEDRPPAVDGREGRKAIEIILAIYRSAQTGAMVRLPLT